MLFMEGNQKFHQLPALKLDLDFLFCFFGVDWIFFFLCARIYIYYLVSGSRRKFFKNLRNILGMYILYSSIYMFMIDRTLLD